MEGMLSDVDLPATFRSLVPRSLSHCRRRSCGARPRVPSDSADAAERGLPSKATKGSGWRQHAWALFGRVATAGYPAAVIAEGRHVAGSGSSLARPTAVSRGLVTSARKCPVGITLS